MTLVRLELINKSKSKFENKILNSNAIVIVVTSQIKKVTKTHKNLKYLIIVNLRSLMRTELE